MVGEEAFGGISGGDVWRYFGRKGDLRKGVWKAK
jgi:hypothetical protein